MQPKTMHHQTAYTVIQAVMVIGLHLAQSPQMPQDGEDSLQMHMHAAIFCQVSTRIFHATNISSVNAQGILQLQLITCITLPLLSIFTTVPCLQSRSMSQ
jgi:hypothetical protein